MIDDILKRNDHREYPLPEGPWIMRQKWEHLLFISYPVSVEMIKGLLPPGLDIDTFAGKAWISIIPFKVSKMRIRNLSALPFLGSYLELNVQTYVKRKGISGVYFFSLDANNLLAVIGARMATLPYFHAQMQLDKIDNAYQFASVREGKERIKFKGHYRPIGEPFFPEKGIREYWLLERYTLWTYKGGRLYRGELHHEKWAIQNVTLSMEELSLPILSNTLLDKEAVVHYAHEKVSLSWMMQKEK
ncbi:hypothetical protein CWR48_12165 [Oceanobacillus arenosus]|uniref:DUF2071 domain-containing protein n=1 Tax=Oceanobacillus arenosus TaxID=1229153 RepID=A0A3D8PT37_9BACI|nr:DUF2071 domain-containing protein [Oceanobacillus arenosus]RDW18329.1 hypothetical protein CWR48_12165 [Oceanobacillus arenosus]